MTGAEVTIDLRADDGRARVAVRYTLEGAVAGTLLPGEILDFAPARVDSIRLGEDAAPATPGSGPGVARTVGLPLPEGSASELRLAYRVDAAAVRRGGVVVGRVPLVTVDRPPADAAPGLFRVRLLVPDDWALTEGFPTGLVELGDATWGAELSVVPAVVRFRARSDGAWRPGLPFFLDGIALLGLGVFAVLGWRHLDRETGR